MGSRTASEGYLQYYIFNVYYSWNRLEEAANSLHSLRRIAQDWHQVELLSLGERALVQPSLGRGDLAAAHQALQKVEMLLEQEEFAGHARWVTALRVGYWLAEANLAEASNWAAQTMFSPKAWNPLRKGEVLMLVRVFLAQQQYTRAVETLENLRQHLDRPGDIETTINFLGPCREAAHQSGKRGHTPTVATPTLR